MDWFRGRSESELWQMLKRIKTFPGFLAGRLELSGILIILFGRYPAGRALRYNLFARFLSNGLRGHFTEGRTKRIFTAIPNAGVAVRLNG